LIKKPFFNNKNIKDSPADNKNQQQPHTQHKNNLVDYNNGKYPVDKGQ
jgi:hypothetical protein